MRGQDLLKNITDMFSAMPAGPVTGLDIGSYSVKAARLGRNSGVVSVEYLAYEKLPQRESISPEELRSEQINIIKKLRSDGKLEGNICLFASECDIKMQNIRMSAAPVQEMDRAVKWKTEEELSIDPQDTCFDYMIPESGSGPASDTKNVVVASAKKNKVRELVGPLEGLGLKIVALEPASIALAAYSAISGSHPSGEIVVLVDIGYNTSSFNVVTDGAVRFSRNLFITGSNLTRSVKDYCGVGYEEAEELKVRYGMGPGSDKDAAEGAVKDRPRQVSYALNFQLERLVTDIDRSFKYYSYQVAMSRVQKLDRMFLTGGGARLEGLDRFLSARLEIPVEIAKPFVKIGFPDASKDIAMAYGPGLVTALGLSTRGIE